MDFISMHMLVFYVDVKGKHKRTRLTSQSYR